MIEMNKIIIIMMNHYVYEIKTKLFGYDLFIFMKKIKKDFIDVREIR